MPTQTNRRDFIRSSTAAVIAASTGGIAKAARVNWEIGCFNRPFTKWTLEEGLKAIKSAGYRTTGLLTRTKDEPFIAASATPEYLASLKKRLTDSGLKANMGALNSRHNIPLEESIAELHKQIDNAHFLSLQYIMSFGADKPEEFDHYVKVMRDAAAYAQEKKIKLVMKPHGGISGASSEILRVIDQVAHGNFSIWYDAGNIIYYTGKDPVAEIGPIAKHISGFCAKDCGAPRGDVMIQFGTGKVDFAAVFKTLKAGGFNGPVMVEGVKVGETADATSVNAGANRQFLEGIFRKV
jgi:sugar phosphate isomerase/epimerase